MKRLTEEILNRIDQSSKNITTQLIDKQVDNKIWCEKLYEEMEIIYSFYRSIVGDKKKAKRKHLQRIQTFPISTIINVIDPTLERQEFEGFSINLTPRFLTFIVKGTKCIECGLEGSYFALEKPGNSKTPHFNLYAFKDGFEILMTSDHIIPRSKGGSNTLNNRQCLCHTCNEKKGSKSEKGDEIKC